MNKTIERFMAAISSEKEMCAFICKDPIDSMERFIDFLSKTFPTQTIIRYRNLGMVVFEHQKFFFKKEADNFEAKIYVFKMENN